MCGVVFRVIGIALEIPRALRERGDRADRGYHSGRAPMAERLALFGVSIRPKYELSGFGTSHEHGALQACPRMSAIVHGGNGSRQAVRRVMEPAVNPSKR